MMSMLRRFIPAFLRAPLSRLRSRLTPDKVRPAVQPMQIVNDLLADKQLYEEMSKREGEVWGKIFTDEERTLAIQADQHSAFSLKLARNRISVVRALKDSAFTPSRGLSLACGSGRAERGLMQNGICSSFHAIDISSQAIEEARKLAAQLNLNITYEQADLNELSLEPASFDFVLTQNCLHHVLRLEDLAEQIHRSLRPNGMLWIHDYIGETQFQYSDERLDIVNRILTILPIELRYNAVNKRSVDKVNRRAPGTLISPFEAIRSAEIMPVFLEKFEIVQKYETDSILHLVCPVGTRGNYAADEAGKLAFELLFFLDELLIRKEILTPCTGMYLLRKKNGA